MTKNVSLKLFQQIANYFHEKKKIHIIKWILLISFMMLFARLIYASINAWNYYKYNHNNPIILKDKI